MSELRIAILKRRETKEIDTPMKIGDDVISKIFLLFLKSIETFVDRDFSFVQSEDSSINQRFCLCTRKV